MPCIMIGNSVVCGSNSFDLLISTLNPTFYYQNYSYNFWLPSITVQLLGIMFLNSEFSMNVDVFIQSAGIIWQFLQALNTNVLHRS